jgi:hypothetical protein
LNVSEASIIVLWQNGIHNFLFYCRTVFCGENILRTLERLRSIISAGFPKIILN